MPVYYSPEELGIKPLQKTYSPEELGIEPIKDEEPVSATTAFTRSAIGNIIPGAGGLAGAEIFAPIGAGLGTLLIPIPGVGTAIGGIAGGLAGAYLGSTVAKKGQEIALEEVPEFAKNIGQSPEQLKQAQVEHPYASLAGGVAGNFATLRPNFSDLSSVGKFLGSTAPKEASTAAKILSTPAANAAIGATISGGLEAYDEEGEFDPYKVGIAALGGGLGTKKTKFGERVSNIATPTGELIASPIRGLNDLVRGRTASNKFETDLPDTQDTEQAPPQTLLLPAPAKPFIDVARRDPLLNPVGNFTENELTPDLLKHINNVRKEQGKTPLENPSLEDIVDAGAPQQEVDRLLSYKNDYTGVDIHTPEQVLQVANSKNIDTTTQGFSDFLNRATGTDDLGKMSQPQLNSALTALSAIPKSPELMILPQGTNASRFTTRQYDVALKGLGAVLDADQTPSMGKTSVIQEVKDFTGLTNDHDAKSLVDTAIRNGDLESRIVPRFEVINNDGTVYFHTQNKAMAESAAKKLGLEVRDGHTEQISFGEQPTQLPGGPDIRVGTFKQGETPAGFQITRGDHTYPSVHPTEESALAHVERLNANNQRMAATALGGITKAQTQIEKNLQTAAAVEAKATNQLQVDAANAKAEADNKVLQQRIDKFKADHAELSKPLEVKPSGMKPVTKQGYTYFEDGKPQATFPSQSDAEVYALSRLPEETLNQIIESAPSQKGLMPKRLAAMAQEELRTRQGTGGIEIKTTNPEQASKNLANLGIYTPEIRQQIEQLRQTLIPTLNKLGLEKVGLRILHSIENGKADGEYVKNLITIALDSKNPLGTLRHESIHALRELGAFTDKEWAVLSEKAKGEWLNEYIKKPGLYELYKKQYKDAFGTLNGFDEYIHEEAIAEAFKHFNVKAPAGLLGNLTYRLREFFTRMGNVLRGHGFESAESIFNKIEEGGYAPNGEPTRIEPRFSLKPNENEPRSFKKYNLNPETDKVEAETPEERQYKLDITKEIRKKGRGAKVNDEELSALNADAEKHGLSPEDVDKLVKEIKNDKNHYPETQGWAPLTAVGIDFKKDLLGNVIPGTQFPKYKQIGYEYHIPVGKTKAPMKIDMAWAKTVADKFQKEIEKLYARAESGDVNAKNIIAHQAWYKNVAIALRKEYGGFGDILADLLGATSPNTPVDTNFTFSIDVMRRFLRGDFNKEMQDFVKYIDDKGVISEYPSADKIRQISGKLYGMNSTHAMVALADLWRNIEPGQAPKARNFALNLIGQSNMATIDVWAARMLRRVANMIKDKDGRRVPPVAEKGVTGVWNANKTNVTGEFGFGAEVMRQVSENLKKKGIYIDPPDLQAIAWFAEKEIWGKKGWTSKSGEGGSFEENMQVNPRSRFIAGHSVQEGEAVPSEAKINNTKNAVENVLKNDPNVVAYRVKPTKGLYGGTVENSFDTEVVGEKGKFDPTNWVSVLAERGKVDNQMDLFASKVLGLDEVSLNARPGVEVYFKTKADMEKVLPVLKKFTAKGQDGFTLAVDPRAKEGEFIGVRIQYVPEISMRWDESLRKKLMHEEGLKRVIEGKKKVLDNIVADISKMPEVAHVSTVHYDTVVIGKENYNDYITKRNRAENTKTGEPVWFGQPLREHVESAIKRYTRKEPSSGVPVVSNRFSLRPDELTNRPGRGAEEPISLGERQEDSVTHQGIHYGKVKTDTLSADKYGTGLRGAEARRLDDAWDDRIKRRVYFYIPKEDGSMTNVESGVGHHVHTQTFENLAPMKVLSKLMSEARGDANTFESLVVEAGYDGYAVPDMGMMVILNHDVPTNYHGTVADLQGKFSLRAPDTKEFKRFFGDSKIVDEEGNPKVMYHGTARDISTFKPKQARAIFVTESPRFAGIFSEMSEDYIKKELLNNLPKEEREKLTREALSLAYKNKEIDKERFNLLNKNINDAIDDASIIDKIKKIMKERMETGQNIMPVFVRSENPFDYENLEHLSDLKDKLDEGYDEWGRKLGDKFIGTISRGGWDVIERPFVQKAIKDLGHDGFYVKEGNEKNLAVYDPAQVKSATGNIGTYDRENPDIRYSLRNRMSPEINEMADRITTKRDDKGFVERFLSAISPDAEAYRKELGRKLRQGLIFQFDPIEEQSLKIAEEQGKDALLAHTSAIASVMQSMTGAKVTSSSFLHGIPEFRDGFTTIKKNTKGLIPILEPLMKEGNGDPYIFQLFQLYAGAKRAKRLTAEGREETFKPEDIQRAAELEKEFPMFKQVFDEYQVYNKGLVDYMKATGVISDKDIQKWTQNWDYIPFYRQMDDEHTVGPKIFGSIAGVAKPKKLKGGEAPLADFLETVTRNARAAIESGMKNEAASRVIRDSIQLGTAEEMFDIKSGPDIVNIKVNGKTKYYRVADPLMTEALKGLNIPQMPWLTFLSKPSQLLRNMVTKDPGFILANLSRDSLSAYITSGTDMTPIVDSFKQFGKILANKSPEAHELTLAGIGGNDYSGDIQTTAKEVSKALRERTGNRTLTEKGLLPASKLWDMLEHSSQSSELATRAEVYKRTLERTGSEAEAVYQAHEIMNFDRRGSWPVTRIVSSLVPFLNARVQGLDLLYRAGYGKMATENSETMKKAFISRSLQLLGMSAMYWYMVHDTPEYKKLSQSDKDNYWIIPGLESNGKPFKFPIPFELGVLFKVLPERIMELTMGNDTGKDFANAMGRQVTSTLSFNLPQFMLPTLENKINYSFFTGQPIVPRGKQDLEPQFQYTEGTSEFAKKIGTELGYSPLKIDHLIQGYMGTMGLYATQMIDSAFKTQGEPVNASKRFEQLPVVKRFFAQDSGTLEAYHDLANQVKTTVDTLNFLERSNDIKEYREYEKSHRGLLGLKGFINSTDSQLKQLREYRMYIERSTKYDADEKRTKLDRIHDMEVNLTKNVQNYKKKYAD